MELKLNECVKVDRKQHRCHSSGEINSLLLDYKSTHYVNFDVVIKDQGCGMSPESKSKLFLNFNKLEENASMNKNGVGLGLSICKNLIEQMGGTVSVESELGLGTTFTINFKTSCLLEDVCPNFYN